MPTSMGSPGLSLAFYYGPEHQRIKQISSHQGTTYYLNPGNNGALLFEKDIKPDNSTEQRNYITAYGQVVAMVKLTNGTTWTTRYMHRDNLGSITAITDEAGTVIERLAYEPFGKRRFATGSDDFNNTIVPLNTDRGYTNHEHLDELTLVHMNGRVYDPVVGRFMSADPQIQDPLNLQSYNRYAYVLNNPLMYTDPSGYSFWTKLRDYVIKPAAAIAVAYFTGYYDGGIFGVGHAIANGAAGGFAGSFVGSGGDFKVGIIGGITGGAMGWVGGAFPGPIENIVAHAGVGCASASMSGGSCGSGALAGGFGAFASANMPGFIQGNRVFELAYVSVVGGTASVLGGGKFANGAQTGAFGYRFNYCAHNGCFDRPFKWGDAAMHWSVGQGEPVTDVKASEIPLDGATYVKNSNGTYQIHTFSPIYGTVTGILNTDGTMSIKPDTYDFDQKPNDSVKMVVRNIFTAIGLEINGRNGTNIILNSLERFRHLKTFQNERNSYNYWGSGIAITGGGIHICLG